MRGPTGSRSSMLAARKAFGFLVLILSSQVIAATSAMSHASNFNAAAGSAGKLGALVDTLASKVANVNGLMKDADPLLLASHLPFLEASCSESEGGVDGGNVTERMRTVGRALISEKRELKMQMPQMPQMPQMEPIEFEGKYGVEYFAGPDSSHGKKFKAEIPIGKLGEYPLELWLPDARTFIPKDKYSAWFLVINLIDSIFLRWYVENAKCDFMLPTIKPPGPEPGEIVCTRPKIKVSYCIKFQTHTPLIQPSVPVCIPEDIMQTLFNIGPAIGGIVENVINQFSPYLLPLLNDYIANGGTQEQLFEALNILLGEPALADLLRGSGGGGGGGLSGAGSGGGSSIGALVGLLQSPAIGVLLDGVDVGNLVLGEGFKGVLSTLIDSPYVPPQFQPLLKETGPYLPYIISNYYGCGGETESFFDAINSVLENPLVQPFLNDPSLLESTVGNSELIAATLPALYASVVTNNPPMYNWLVTLPTQCIVDQGYVQPVAVILTQGTPFAQVGAAVPKLVDDYYNTGCLTEQMLAFTPVLLESLTLPPAQQTNTLFQKTGTTPSGEEVGFTKPFNGGPSILQCLTPNLSVLTTVLAVG